MYQKVQTDHRFVEREEETLAFWQAEKIFQKSIDQRAACPPYTFYDGPPTANGKPHIGHILTRAIKDIIPRYHTMQGKNVLRKAGWDTHGLPVELEVERMLGINGKDEIEAYGIEPFVEQCRKSVWTYKEEWEKMSERVGFWADMENPYITYENDYIESEWWALKKIWEAGLLYQGHKIVPYCPRCGTALSSHEVAQGYQTVTEQSVYVRFPVEGEPDTYLAAWTTTPWTLPSNMALAVNPKEPYVLAQTREGDRTIRTYLAQALLETVLGPEAQVIARLSGSDLAGKRYQPLFPYARKLVEASGKAAYYVTEASFVTLTDGTGIVHIAPAFGEDDAEVGKAYDLPFVQLVREDGTMPDEVTDFAGVFCKDADPGLIDKLQAQGLVIKTVPYEHSYPFCWRCDTALIYYARNSWFVQMTAVRDQLLANNQMVNWIPETIRDGRFGHFLENVIDWSISRERYWGTPLPIWTCDCGQQQVVGSIAELKALSDDCPDDIELHKPYIDRVHLRCIACGGRMTRVPEVLDCWFDSGAMPFAQWHYPFENKALFDQHFPADFISEALDQTRGWFYTLMALSTVLFEQPPYRNVLVMGHVQDKHGQKMSKHKGNVVDPWAVLNRHGADAVRWYFFVGSSPWLPSRFSPEAVAEVQRKYLGTLWNTYAFYILYARIDGFDPTQHAFDPDRLSEMDRWALSRLNSLVEQVTLRLDRYDITGSARLIQAFVDDLSNWYVRRSRERFWQPGMGQDKVHAYLTLGTVLETVTLLTAPFTPFMAENIYQNLVLSHRPQAPQSVHLCDFPQADQALIDLDLEADMQAALDVVVLGRAARNAANLKIRQPLQTLYLVAPRPLPAAYQQIILDELNIRDLKPIDTADDLIAYRLKPQLRTLGPRLGARLPAVSQALAQLDGRAALRELDETAGLTISVDGQPVHLAREDLLIERVQPEGLATQQDRGTTVAIDTRLTPDLIEEGFVREIISKVQTMRKDSGFEVTDRIVLRHSGNAHIAGIMAKHGQRISAEVLADRLEEGTGPNSKTWDLNGQEATLSVSVL